MLQRDLAVRPLNGSQGSMLSTKLLAADQHHATRLLPHPCAQVMHRHHTWATMRMRTEGIAQARTRM